MASRAVHKDETVIETRELAGAKLVFIRRRFSRLAAFRLLLRRGSAHDPDGLTGLAALCSETLFRGTSARNVDELAAAIDGIGFRHETEVIAEDFSIGGEVLPEHFGAALELVSEAVTAANFPEKEVRAARETQLQAISYRDEHPGKRLADVIGRRLWGALGRNPDGDAEDVRKIESRHLDECLDKMRRTKERLLVVAGAMEPDDVEKIAAGILEKLPEASDTMPEPIFDKPNAGGHHVEMDSEQVNLGLAFPAPPADSPDRAAAALAVAVLSSGFSSRLFVELREKRGLVYSVGAALHSRRGRGALFATASTSTERARETAVVLQRELKRLPEDLNAVDLEVARTQLKARVSRRFESAAGSADSVVADIIAGREPRSPAEMIATLDTPEPEDARNVWKRIMESDPVKVSVGRKPVFD